MLSAGWWFAKETRLRLAGLRSLRSFANTETLNSVFLALCNSVNRQLALVSGEALRKTRTVGELRSPPSVHDRSGRRLRPPALVRASRGSFKICKTF